MSTVQQAIEVSAPLHTVYEQLAMFESYPRFMTGVERVTRVSDDQTHWIMDMDGQRREFDAQITERSLDERVSWTTMDGPLLAETITLRPMGEARTQVVAQLEADAAFLMPSDRHGQESLDRRLKADLASFKRLIELDDEEAARQIAGSGRLDPGVSAKSISAMKRGAALLGGTGRGSASTPATVAALAKKHNAGGRHVAGPNAAGDPATSGPDAGTGAPGTMLPGGTDRLLQAGTAGMGGHTMSPDDAWGAGMINEEERGSAHDY